MEDLSHRTGLPTQVDTCYIKLMHVTSIRLIYVASVDTCYIGLYLIAYADVGLRHDVKNHSFSKMTMCK